jgi:hypothetical protein
MEYADSSVRQWRLGRYGVVQGFSRPDAGVPDNRLDPDLNDLVAMMCNLDLEQRIEIYEDSNTPDHVIELIEHFVHMDRVAKRVRSLHEANPVLP